MLNVSDDVVETANGNNYVLFKRIFFSWGKKASSAYLGKAFALTLINDSCHLYKFEGD